MFFQNHTFLSKSTKAMEICITEHWLIIFLTPRLAQSQVQFSAWGSTNFTSKYSFILIWWCYHTNQRTGKNRAEKDIKKKQCLTILKPLRNLHISSLDHASTFDYYNVIQVRIKCITRDIWHVLFLQRPLLS